MSKKVELTDEQIDEIVRRLSERIPRPVVVPYPQTWLWPEPQPYSPFLERYKIWCSTIPVRSTATGVYSSVV